MKSNGTRSGRVIVLWHRYFTWMVLGVGLFVTAVGTRVMKSSVTKVAEQEFSSRSLQHRSLIAYRLADHARILMSGAALFQASDDVTRDEWRVFTQYLKLEQQLPGIQGMGFSLLIAPADLERHTQEIRSEGFPEYQVKPAGEREMYSSIIYLQPFSGRNLRAFGYDMLSEPVRRAAMEQARDTNASALSGKVVLVQETDQDVQAGTLMYVPVYHKGMPIDSVEQRRAALHGWVYSPYRMNDLFRSVLADQVPEQETHRRLEVFDGERLVPENLLYSSRPILYRPLWFEECFSREISVDCNGHYWTLRFTQYGNGIFTVEYIRVWLTLGGGLIITLLLAGLMHLMQRTGDKAQRMAYELTVDLHDHEKLLQNANQRLTLAVRAGGVGIWDYDVVNNLLVWDEQMHRLYGITQDQFGGTYKDWKNVLHPEDLQRCDAEIQLALTGDRDFDAEFRILWPDGSLRYIRGFASVARDASGSPLRMVGTNWDMTARKLAEMELARISVIQRELMRLATEFVNVPLTHQDAAIDQSLATIGQLIHADRAYLFAYAFGKDVMSNTHEWCDSGVAPEIGNLQAVPNTLFPDWVETHQRGEWIHIPSVAALPAENSLRQVLEPQGIRSLITLPLMQGKACLGFVGFTAARQERDWQQEDIALLRVLAELYAHFEARRAEERELIQARDVAQTAVLAKSLFLGNMSHEIRTPLNAILGYAQIMERECRECPSQHRLRPITRSGEHLLELLNDLLELVRMDAHQVTLTPGFFDFYQVLEDARLIFVGSAQAKGLTLEWSLAPDLPQFIHADAGKVRQILLNLIGNAVKFTAHGGVCLSVTAKPAGPSAGYRIVVDIRDTGCGIAQDEQERIFNIFEQANQTRQSGKGTGLGLYLSRRYAQALGGDVTVSSQPGQGSCFRFNFNARIARGGEVVHRLRIGNVLQLTAGQRAWRLLVVDDEPVNRDMLAGMLEAVGFTVETAVDAAQALERLRQTPDVDLVLMDKCLPEIDGYEAIRRLRQLPGGAGLPVLIVTACGFADELQLALAAGADGYVAKPVRLEQLLAEIGRVTDVHYDYEPPAPCAPHVIQAADAGVSGMANVPQAQRKLLDRALRRGDIQQLRDLIAGIENQHAGLAAGMLLLVDAYDYGRLRQMLDSVPSEN